MQRLGDFFAFFLSFPFMLSVFLGAAKVLSDKAEASLPEMRGMLLCQVQQQDLLDPSLPNIQTRAGVRPMLWVCVYE